MSSGQGLPPDSLFSFIAAVGFGLTALYVSITRRHKPTWRAGVILLCACAEITMAHGLQRCSTDQETRIFWYKMVYIGFTVTPTTFLFLALRFSGLGQVLTNRTRFLLSIFPLITCGLILTNEIHGLVWDPATTASYATSTEFLSAGDSGIGYWILVTYSYLAMGLGCFFLIRLLVRSHRIYGWQTGIIIGGALYAVIGSMLDIFRVSPLPPFYTTELGLAVGSITVAFILSPLRRQDLLAVTRTTVFNNIDDTVIVVDGDYRIVDMNLAAEKVIGIPVSRALSSPLEHLLPELTALLAPDASNNGEVVLHRGKTQRIYDLRLSVIQGWQGHIVNQVIVLRDITERKQSERALKTYSGRLEEMVADRTAELQAALQKAQVSDKLKSEFVVNVNHELRTPLTNLLLYYQLLNAHPGEKSKERLAVIGRELQRLRNLIEDLLNISNLNLKQEGFYPKPCDLNQLILTFINDRSVLANELNLTLKSELDASVPYVWLDETMIGQAISNLLTNAMKYTPPGGCVEIRTRAVFDPSDEPQVVISVQDTGPGISQDDLPNIFERFYRGKSGHESGIPGTGLGLAIVKEVVERHQGRIEAGNVTTGCGAIFRIWLPVESKQKVG